MAAGAKRLATLATTSPPHRRALGFAITAAILTTAATIPDAALAPSASHQVKGQKAQLAEMARLKAKLQLELRQLREELRGMQARRHGGATSSAAAAAAAATARRVELLLRENAQLRALLLARARDAAARATRDAGAGAQLRRLATQLTPASADYQPSDPASAFTATADAHAVSGGFEPRSALQMVQGGGREACGGLGPSSHAAQRA